MEPTVRFISGLPQPDRRGSPAHLLKFEQGTKPLISLESRKMENVSTVHWARIHAHNAARDLRSIGRIQGKAGDSMSGRYAYF